MIQDEWFYPSREQADQQAGWRGLRRIPVVVVIAGSLAAVLCGAGVYGLRWAAGFVRDGASVDRCHTDEQTAARVRREAVLASVPPGAHPGALREEQPCGRPTSPGAFDREVTDAGPAPKVSAFYATLAAGSGWRTAGADGVFAARKPDGHGCEWDLVVRNTARGTYHVRISYVPRDLSTSCA